MHTDDPHQVAQNLFRWSERLVGIDSGLLYVARGEHLVALAVFEISPAVLGPNATVPIGGTHPIAEAAHHTRPWVMEPTAEPHKVLDLLGWESGLAVPLVIDWRVVGVYLAGWRTPFGVTPDVVAVLEGAGSLAASAIHRAHLLDEVKREEQRLRTLLDGLPLPALRISLSRFMVTWVNQRARKLLGPVEGIGVDEVLNDAQVSHLDGDHISEERASRGLWRVAVPSRVQITTVDGTSRVVAPQLAHIGRDEAVMMLVDVTAEASLEAQRRRFVRMVSHHLRTPLTPILGYAELLSASAQSPDLVEIAAEMRRAVLELTGHVRRLEQIAQLQPVEANHLQPLIVGELIDRAWQQANQPRSLLRVQGRTDATTLSVREHVVSALTEVFVNAFAHGTPPVEVVIEAKEDEVTIRVKDSGPGIEDAWADGIFAPYLNAQGGYLAPPAGHLGLGLPLARALIEATRGELSYRDNTFEFVLPATLSN